MEDDSATLTSNDEGDSADREGARYVGIDIGAETIKVAEIVLDGGAFVWRRRKAVEHGKNPARVLPRILDEFDWGTVDGAAVSGRLSRQVRLPRVPTKEAQARGARFLLNGEPVTLVSIGSHGFSVLELRESGDLFRENNRCSQGTGNFLRQLTERFGLGVEEASELCADVSDPAPLSGRCPVILKTDMTHLANRGEDRTRILAGLFDAVCANVTVFIKPRRCPPQVLLAGGVSRSRRVRANFERYLAQNGMKLRMLDGDDGIFLEALGCALTAADQAGPVPRIEALFANRKETPLERLPPLSDAMSMVRRMPARQILGPPRDSAGLIIGLDIGSTGSKALAMEPGSGEIAWQSYRRTAGDPVGAAQALVRQFTECHAAQVPVRAFAVTGSGREIVGSLLTTCYGAEAVFVLNEIVAHAEGALHYDPQVDTIFEIGGQDAKYIRLADGRVIDCAMNEACSAGTGSFIEEQGRKFAGLEGVTELAATALAARWGVSLGQHCSVFMAEIIDEAVAAGVCQDAIVAGLYDSIVQNYLNRVKGSRSVGQVIFCQGMPFSADALAAAVARQTGSRVIVPPDPGMVGAFGIALLARRELRLGTLSSLEPRLFLDACVESKDSFVCRSRAGCGGSGNRCRIDCLRTVVGGQQRKFNWGGGCSLYDKAPRKKKLPNLSPDPFRERSDLVQGLMKALAPRPGRKRVAITDEFSLKGLFPFFATFLHELGLDLHYAGSADLPTLKLGIQEANVPFCAPMQLYHGLISRMASEADLAFIPMIRGVPRLANEELSKTCPIVQASGDLIRWCLARPLRERVFSPVIDIQKGNLDSNAFQESCRKIAVSLGANQDECQRAFQAARKAQASFDRELIVIGQRALDFCAEQNLPAVVVLGRPYTINNKVLNSNVPALLREQGVVAIPVDCYPVAEGTPVFQDMYWGHGQRILRAASQIRHAPRVYSVYASNYSCGPDSFNLHFYTYLMEGKPFAIIETDGHSGDAGTKTRIEAFLHCVHVDFLGGPRQRRGGAGDALNLRQHQSTEFRSGIDRVLVPSLGLTSEVAAACLRGLGIPAESLPEPNAETVRTGRRHTSGKECLPLCVTLGGLLQRIELERDPKARFVFLMPRALGPCRFGVYNLLNQVVLDRLGLSGRVRVWSPRESSYFSSFSPAFTIIMLAGFMAGDALYQGLLDTRPVETERGAAAATYARFRQELLGLLEEASRLDRATPAALWQLADGRLFGMPALLDRAAREYARVRATRRVPAVLVVGEIFVRCEPFSNGWIAEKLEQRGLRVILAPFHEWIEYVGYWNRKLASWFDLSARLNAVVHKRIGQLLFEPMAGPLGWPRRINVPDSLDAASAYVRRELNGEAVLTVGTALEEWRAGRIDGVVSVGPLECMPNKIAEAQFFHLAEQEGVLSLTLSLNGDPVDDEVLDSFAFEVRARFRRKHGLDTSARPPRFKARPCAAAASEARRAVPACSSCAVVSRAVPDQV